MRKVKFVCPECGGKKLYQIEVGVLMKSPIKAIGIESKKVVVDYKSDGTLIITDESPVYTLGYECGNCHAYLVSPRGEECKTPKDLYRWLRGADMIGKEKKNEKANASVGVPSSRPVGCMFD